MNTYAKAVTPLIVTACLLGGIARAPVVAGVVAAPTLGRIDRLDPRLDALVPAASVIEVLASGLRWSEGPVWDRANRRLLFSDVPNNVVYAWSEKAGLSAFLKPSGYTGPEGGGGREPGANGLVFDAQGRLVLCQQGNRQIARLAKDGTFTPLASRFDGKRFNSPNDLVFGPDRALYFTDPPYGLTKMFDDPGREIGWNGVYRVAPDGRITLLVKELRAPNGIALSPGAETLYVNSSDPDRPVVMAYELRRDGTVGAGKVLFDAASLRGQGPGAPDGLKVDRQGNLFTTGPGGILVLSPRGEHLGTIVTGVPTANCAFGDDGGTLYITASDKLCRVKTLTRGLGF